MDSPLFSFNEIPEPKAPQQPPAQKQAKPKPRDHSVTLQEMKELKESRKQEAFKLMSKYMRKDKQSPPPSTSEKIQKVVEDSIPKNVAELQNKKKKLSKIITTALEKIKGIPQCNLVFYGSTENGFWQGKASDIDCSIVTANPLQLFQIHHVVRNFENQRLILNGLKSHFPKEVKADVINASNLSFLKCSMQFSHDGEKNLLQFDINVGSVLGNYNSELLRTYVNLEPQFFKAGHYLKYWSKIQVRKQHGYDSTQTLSSYALLLMLLVFVQSRYELLPRLQKIPDTDGLKQDIISVLDQRKVNRRPQTETVYFETNVYFNQNKQVLSKYMFCNEELTTAQILIDFFFFYAFVFDPDTMIINVPEGGFTYKEKHAVEKPDYRQIPFSIIDPFDPFHNPGKTIRFSTPQYKVTMTEMIKAFFDLAT